MLMLNLTLNCFPEAGISLLCNMYSNLPFFVSPKIKKRLIFLSYYKIYLSCFKAKKTKLGDTKFHKKGDIYDLLRVTNPFASLLPG